MTLSYLSLQGTDVVAGALVGAGTAKIMFRPDTGQYWAPTIVQVCTRTGTPIKCNLHAGGVAALTDATTIKDFTYQGSSDTSSILSGLIIGPGEGILCEFQLGTPGEVVFATLAGVSSDIPATLGVTPEIPGARFLGAANIALQTGLTTYVQTNQPMAGGVSFSSSPIDMRGYSSFSLTYENKFLIAPAAFVLCNVACVWYDATLLNDGTPALSRVVYEDEWDLVPADNTHGAFDNPYNRLEVQDVVHGAFLKIFLSLSNSGLSPQFSLEIIGNSRTVPCQYIRNTQSFGVSSASFGSDAALLIATTSPVFTGTREFLLRYGPGPATGLLINGSANTTQFIFQTVDTEMILWQTSLAASAVLPFTWAHPKKQCKVTMNVSGAANNALIHSARQLTQTGG